MDTSQLDKKSPFSAIKWIQSILIVFFVLYLIIWAISSPVSKYFIKPILHEQGLALASQTSISYNPFLSQLTISDLSIYPVQKDETQVVFSLEKLTVRLTLFRLLFDEIAISKFALNDGYIKIEKNATQLIIAGVDLNKASAEPAKKEPVASEATPFLYQVLLPKLAINRFNIVVDNKVNNERSQHQINISALLIEQLIASQGSQQAKLTLQSIVDSAELKVSADVTFEQGQGEIASVLALTQYPLEKIKGYVSELSDLSGKLSVNSEQRLIIAPEQLKVAVSEAKLTNDNLALEYQQQFFKLAQLEHSFKDIALTLSQGKMTELTGTSQLSLNKADIYYQQPSQKLAHFEQLSLNDIKLEFTDKPHVNIASIVVDDMFASKNETSEYAPILTLKQFHISDIQINAQQLAINKISLDNLQSEVILNKDKALANLVSLPVAKPAEQTISADSQATQQAPDVEKQAFIISLNEFSLTNDNTISFIDNSVDPIYKRSFYIDTLYLGPLSNAKDKQQQQTPFELIGRSNKYAHFTFKGFTQPFAQKPVHHVKGYLKELSLPAVSTYMKQAMQMELKSGQLNTDIDVTLTGEQLDGKVAILLQGLETAIADSNEAGALIDQGALPFNMALGMLKDRNGGVELDVPLSGSTSDPQFGMGSIVTLITQKAIWMATQDYLMKTFVPYANIVSAAMTVGEFALKLRFEDLIYQAKQIEPNAEQQTYLNAFIALMQNKKDTRVNICAISTPDDLDLPAGSKITDKSQINQLKAIGEQREEAFKDYIIKHGQIESSRLLLCAPKIDSSKSAKPRIALSV